LKQQFRNWLWEKVRLRRVKRRYNPRYFRENNVINEDGIINEDVDIDELQNAWILPEHY
jgi:hypothetical protein